MKKKTDEKDVLILKLQKENAELKMDIIKRNYLDVRNAWKETLKALGEPDPDEPPLATLPVSLKE